MADRSGLAAPARVGVSALARAAAFAAAVAVSGCGGGTPTPTRVVATPTAAGHPISTTQLRVQVAGAFRQGLYRMAVMDQPADDATDLGQELPTGRVRQIDCAPSPADASRPGLTVSSCLVRWEQVDGAAERTRLRVAENRHGCWNAVPRPGYRSRFDATIGAYAEHPLNLLASVHPGC